MVYNYVWEDIIIGVGGMKVWMKISMSLVRGVGWGDI